MTAAISVVKHSVGTQTATWAALGASTNGDPYEYGKFADKTVQMTGTFGGTVTLKGSNDNSNWFTLTDADGIAIALTAAGGKLIRENPRYIRPESGSGVTSVVVTIHSAGA